MCIWILISASRFETLDAHCALKLKLGMRHCIARKQSWGQQRNRAKPVCTPQCKLKHKQAWFVYKLFTLWLWGKIPIIVLKQMLIQVQPTYSRFILQRSLFFSLFNSDFCRCSILFDSTSEGELGRTILGMKSNLCKGEIRKLICLNCLKLRLNNYEGCNCCHHKSSFCMTAKGLRYWEKIPGLKS